MTLGERAQLLLVAEIEFASGKRTKEALAAELVAEIEAELASAATAGDVHRETAARRIEIPGALVTYVAAGSSTNLQQTRCVEMLEALGARLRELGLTDVKDTAPYSASPRPAYLKITPRL